MKKIKVNTLVIVAYLCLLVSILSLFTTIIGYRNGDGEYRSFSVLDFIFTGEFDQFVTVEYMGTIYMELDGMLITCLAALGIIALSCAVVGIAILSKQGKNTWPFVMTLIGLVGTMVPSILIIIFVTILNKNYLGTLSCGIYPVITPIAMIISMLAATQMHRRNREYVKRLRAARGLISPGGDL